MSPLVHSPASPGVEPPRTVPHFFVPAEPAPELGTPASATLALWVWDAYIAEGEVFELDQAAGLLGRSLAKFDGWTRRNGGHWQEDIQERWGQDRALVAELRQKLERQPNLSLPEALRGLSEERWEFQNRARELLSQMRQSDSSGSYLLAHALRFASEGGQDASLGAQLLEDAERAEGRDKADKTPLAVYDLLLRASDPGIRERARGKILERTNGKSFSTLAWETLRNCGTEDLAQMAAMGAASRLGTLARLATLKRWGPVLPGWRGIALGRGAEWLVEGGTLSTFHVLQASLGHDAGRLFSAAALQENLSATLLTLSGLKVFRALGQAVAFPLAEALVSQFGRVAPRVAEPLARALRVSLGHAIGLSGMIAVTQVETAAGLREGPVGGFREAAAQDTLAYLKYGMAPRIFGPRAFATQGAQLKEIRRLERASLDRGPRETIISRLDNPLFSLSFLFTGASGFGWFGKNGKGNETLSQSASSERGPLSSLQERLGAIARRLRHGPHSVKGLFGSSQEGKGGELEEFPLEENLEIERETSIPGDIDEALMNPVSLPNELRRLGEISATQPDAARSFLRGLRSSGLTPDPRHLQNSLAQVLESATCDADLIETLLGLATRHRAVMFALEEMRVQNHDAARLIAAAAGRGDINAIAVQAGCAEQIAAARSGDLDALYDFKAASEGKLHQIPILFGLYQEFYSETHRLGRGASTDRVAPRLLHSISQFLKEADPASLGQPLGEGSVSPIGSDDKVKILESLERLGNRRAEAALLEESRRNLGSDSSLEILEQRALQRKRGAVEALAERAVEDPEAVFLLDRIAVAHRRGGQVRYPYKYPDSEFYKDSILRAMEQLDVSHLTDLARGGSARAREALELLAQRGNDHATFLEKLRKGSSRPPQPSLIDNE